ncbi:MAG: protein kinase [Anaerolineae bacterium]|nr:protein kinase [Anaerolineae bacterium]
MKCDSCGHINIAGAEECENCGYLFGVAAPSTPKTTRRIICPDCGTASSSASDFCGRCGQLLPVIDFNYAPSPDREPILYAGKYELTQLIGQGGMGRVYKARTRGDQQGVAIKEMIIHRQQSQENQAMLLKALQQEVEILGHLHVVRTVPVLIEGFQEWNRRRFFVMEFVEGKNLEDVLKERGRPFPPETVIAWAVQLCEMLQILHNQQPNPIVHQDLTLDNIILRQDTATRDQIMLLDFGIARFVRAGTKLSKLAGKTGYAPKEQLFNGRPEPRSDLYSLAVCMHRLLTLSDPVEKLPPAIEANSLVPQWLSDLIAINLSEEPRERYESAARMREDLLKGRVTALLQCPRCGTENERALIYCKACAATLLSVPRKCGDCGEFIPYNAHFCPHCGKKTARE